MINWIYLDIGHWYSELRFVLFCHSILNGIMSKAFEIKIRNIKRYWVCIRHQWANCSYEKIGTILIYNTSYVRQKFQKCSGILKEKAEQNFSSNMFGTTIVNLAANPNEWIINLSKYKLLQYFCIKYGVSAIFKYK